MASYTSAWLIGSVRDIDYDVILTGDASTQAVAGDLYLYHATDSLSLLAQVVAAMTAATIPDAAAVLTRDRRVKLSSSGNFSVQWVDLALRNLLGFNANLAAASSYTAPLISPLLWSPAKPLLPGLSPLNCVGNRRPLAYWTASPTDGTPFVVSHGTRTDQSWSASHVALNRMQTVDELGGEWIEFFEESAAKGYNFTVYPEVIEESGSSVAAVLSDPLGPYVLSPNSRAPSWDFRRSRGFEWINRRADWSIACRVVPEYT